MARWHVPKTDALQGDFDYKVSGDVAFFRAGTALALLVEAVGNRQTKFFDNNGEDGDAKPLLFLPATRDSRGRRGSRAVGRGTTFDDAETGAEGRVRTYTPILRRRPVPIPRPTSRGAGSLLPALVGAGNGSPRRQSTPPRLLNPRNTCSPQSNPVPPGRIVFRVEHINASIFISMLRQHLPKPLPSRVWLANQPMIAACF